MPLNFMIAVFASVHTDWREVILFIAVVAPLIAVTVYGARRAFASRDRVAGAAIICGWAFLIGWLIAVIYLLAIDRPRRARVESRGTALGYIDPFVPDEPAR